MVFIENKYTKWYYGIINNAQSREINGYVETHHIIPKSLGGNNKKENLVQLSAREHFLCHYLLPKMLIGKDRLKMIYALWHISNQENCHQDRYKISSKMYATIREQFSYNHSQWMLENYHLIRDKVIESWTDDKRKIQAEKTKKFHTGKVCSEETIEKLKNKVWTEKQLANLKEISKISADKRRGKPWSEHRRSVYENNKPTRTPESKKLISDKLKGRLLSSGRRVGYWFESPNNEMILFCPFIIIVKKYKLSGYRMKKLRSHDNYVYDGWKYIRDATVEEINATIPK